VCAAQTSDRRRRELGNYGEIRIGTAAPSALNAFRSAIRRQPSSDFDTQNFFSEFRYDTVDNVKFPRNGATFQLGYRNENGTGGDAGDADLMVFDQLYAHSWGRHTAILWTSAGTRLDNDTDVLRSYFSLGGFLNMSGLTPESLVGPNFAIARGIYYRQVGRQGQGFLNVPVYVGASIEAGNVWSSRREMSFNTARTNGSLFVGLDTLLGPVYVAAGFDESGGSAYTSSWPDFLTADARRTENAGEAPASVQMGSKKQRWAYRPRLSCSFSTLSNFSAGRRRGGSIHACVTSRPSRIALRRRAVPVRLVPVRAEQLPERITRFQRDANTERTLNAHVGAAQVVRSGNTHEISERQGRKRR
jgi:hypothetical protein